MEILGKGLSLNHPEDLEVTERERALGKWSVKMLAFKKKKKRKTSFKNQHMDVLMGFYSHNLCYFLQLCILYLR